MELSVALATESPLRLIEVIRALRPHPGLLSWPNIVINVCERAVIPDSINKFIKCILRMLNVGFRKPRLIL